MTELDAAWEECRARRGTFAGDEKIARAYFEEGHSAALASRTVETAEEWEYALDDGDAIVTRRGWTLTDLQEHAARLLAHGNEEVLLVRRHPASSWEPVPPTPEEQS